MTQLRTFAWVRVPAAIQAAVAREEADAAAETKAREEEMSEESDADTSFVSSSMSSTGDPVEANSAPGTLEPPIVASGTSTPSSVSSARTAIPLGARTGGSGREATSKTGSGVAPVEAFIPKVLLQPTKATGLESRYLAHIARALETAENRDARECWERCLKYFNGEHALEKIAMREGWKRKRVEALRQSWGRLGVLMEVRHW